MEAAKGKRCVPDRDVSVEGVLDSDLPSQVLTAQEPVVTGKADGEEANGCLILKGKY